MLGASGAVGTQALHYLLQSTEVDRLVLLGRRTIEGADAKFIEQHEINIFDTTSYEAYVTDVSTAICTLGVGEPSKMSKEEFIKIDKDAVLDFARACRTAGVKHFELLASVGINAQSKNYYLRTKGELVEELKALNFDRLSIFEPSMILTPENRYGFSQAILLKIWPVLSYLLIGGLRKYRGIKIETLGKAMAKNVFVDGEGFESLLYDDFNLLSGTV